VYSYLGRSGAQPLIKIAPDSVWDQQLFYYAKLFGFSNRMSYFKTVIHKAKAKIQFAK